MQPPVLRRAVAALAGVVVAVGLAVAADTKAELQTKLRDTGLVGDWIYDDVDAGFARAAREKKPLCIVFR
jgi:hypothetical protein